MRSLKQGSKQYNSSVVGKQMKLFRTFQGFPLIVNLLGGTQEGAAHRIIPSNLLTISLTLFSNDKPFKGVCFLSVLSITTCSLPQSYIFI